MLRSREQIIRERAFAIWEREGQVHGLDEAHWLRAEAEVAALGEHLCIFDEGHLGHDTKPEHVLLNCLGGRKATTRVICSEHNNRFGGSIDDEVASQVKILCNMLQLESGTGKPPPSLKKLNAGNATINLRNDGRPELAGRPFTILKGPDGYVEISITANSEAHLRRLIPDMAAAAGCTEEQMREALIAADARRIAMRPGTVGHHMAFGGELALRSVTKSCLVLWSLAVGNEHVRTPVYDDARRFVLDGGGEFNKDHVEMDSRFFEIHDGIVKRFGPLLNVLYIQSNDAGRVIGHFTLYNIVAWRIVLAPQGGIPNQNIAVASNPLDPAKWSDKVAVEMPIEFGWLDAPDYDLARCRQRIVKVAEQYFRDARLREINRICDEVFSKYGLSENDPINPRDVEEIINQITERTGAMLAGVPHETKISPADLRKIL